MWIVSHIIPSSAQCFKLANPNSYAKNVVAATQKLVLLLGLQQLPMQTHKEKKLLEVTFKKKTKIKCRKKMP